MADDVAGRRPSLRGRHAAERGGRRAHGALALHVAEIARRRHPGHALPDEVLDPVLAAALAKNPDDRFPRCSDFARTLAEQTHNVGAPTPRRELAHHIFASAAVDQHY